MCQSGRFSNIQSHMHEHYSTNACVQRTTMMLTPVKHFVTLKVLVLLQNQGTQWLWELDILPPFLHYEPLLRPPIVNSLFPVTRPHGKI